MGEAIGQLLPFAVGVAVSPMPIVAVVLMLVTPRARTNGPAFLLGWIVGIALAGAVLLAIAGPSRGFPRFLTAPQDLACRRGQIPIAGARRKTDMEPTPATAQLPGQVWRHRHRGGHGLRHGRRRGRRGRADDGDRGGRR
jgi:hypothetical protein